MAPKKSYTPLQMAQAITAVREGEKISTAAKKFGVPRITLHDKISGKTPIECSMGPSTYLSTEEEAILEKWILDMAERHIPITRDELLDSVQRIIVDQKKTTPFTDNRPGKKWYNLFLKRHPSLSERTAQNLTTARDAVTEEGIKRWFGEVSSYLQENNLREILEDPSRIFNGDESAFYLSPKAGKVLAKKGDKHVYQSSGDEKDNLTVLITGNAAGQLAPPMVVFSYERIPSTISSKFPEDWAMGRSPSGWMCSSTFFEYIANIFNPWLLQQNIPKPVLFFLDGHRSHLTLHLSNFCAQNGIEIVALYPNSTHILQPMDLAIFRPLKIYWNKAVKDWKLKHLGMNLKREDFAPVLKTALESITESSVKNGFRAGGLYPFGPDYVDLSKIKSRNKKEASSEQILFFDYLEKEIVAKLQKEKLQIFNDLYYKDRQNLNIHLNEEDLSLYIIWASNKQAIELSGHVNEQSTSPQTLVEIPNPNEINPAESLSATNADTDVQYQFDIQLDHDYLPHITLSNAGYDATTSTCTPNDAPKSREILDNSLTVASPSSNLNDPIPTTSTSCSYTFMFDIATKITPSKELTRPGNSQIGQSSAEKTPVKELTRPETSKINQSSIKKTPLKELAIPGTTKFIQKKGESTYIIPSPFKRNLFWPGEDENKGKKRKLKEKIPFVITSKPWREYNERKDIEKKEKEKQKEIKAKEREERRLLKLRETEEKKKRQMEKEIKTKEGKKIKKSKPDDTSSDNTDIEVHYAESEDSLDMQIDAEKTEHEKSESSTQSEDVPLIRFSKKSRKYSIGNYVIIRYEGEYFPGVIEGIRGNRFEISTMTFSVGNTYKWPEKKDKIFYEKSDIIEAISPPVLCNKRGFYTIPEMKKYLPFAI
ncbi:uncharacterized protein LOC132903318 [Amyelois transitella]|uniref:uncharacterized protein LOC106134232 n=1 Tax=Amyelois transitella TaxID=680683 RepID=UPI00067B1E5F|nr:uncharacterized protein LOC106134232 [Amyelois transitella]XP_060807333.1 uncharacterized protein LOC132903318 [Amyelois transitella]